MCDVKWCFVVITMLKWLCRVTSGVRQGKLQVHHLSFAYGFDPHNVNHFLGGTSFYCAEYLLCGDLISLKLRFAFEKGFDH